MNAQKSIVAMVLATSCGFAGCAVDGTNLTSAAAPVGVLTLTAPPAGVALSARLAVDGTSYDIALTEANGAYDASMRDANGTVVASWHGPLASDQGGAVATIDGQPLGGSDDAPAASAPATDTTAADTSTSTYDSTPTPYDQPVPPADSSDATASADLAQQITASVALLRRESGEPTGRALIALGDSAAALAADPAHAAQHAELEALTPLGAAIAEYATDGSQTANVTAEALTYSDCTLNASLPWIQGTIYQHNPSGTTGYGALHAQATARCGRSHHNMLVLSHLYDASWATMAAGGEYWLSTAGHTYASNSLVKCTRNETYYSRASIFLFPSGRPSTEVAHTVRSRYITCPRLIFLP
jgi:hypothetical protein